MGTIKAVSYQAAGEECHVNKTNSVLGLSMYASYFLLFFKLFVDNYYVKTRAGKKSKSLREVARTMSRKITQTVEFESEGEQKKLNCALLEDKCAQRQGRAKVANHGNFGLSSIGFAAAT